MDITVINTLDIKDSTKETYTSHYIKINSIIKKTKLTNHKRIIRLFNKNLSNSGTKRVYLSVLISYLTLLDNENLADEYRKIRDNIPIEQKKLTQQQLDIDYQKDILKFLKGIKDNSYKTTREQFIISFYLLMPPRRKKDYLLMKYTESSKNISEDFNYLVGKRQGKYKYALVFNQHKTMKTFGKQTFPIKNKHLIKIIHNHKLKEGERFFSKSARTFGVLINKITKKIFGIELGINELRKLHSTTKFSKFLKDLQENSEMMGHSVGTKLKFYIN